MRILQPSKTHYRKTHHLVKTCPFCDPIVLKDQGIPELETEYWRVVACKYPYLDGNLILIPKRHIEDTDSFTTEEWTDFRVVLEQSKDILSKLFETTSFNVGLNIGPESGRSIAHIHWMLLPRPAQMRSVPVFEALNDLVVVTMDYKMLIKKIRASLTKKKKQSSKD